MNVLLVVPHSPSHYVVPPLGLGYLATALRALPVEVSILDCVRERVPPEAFGARVAAARADLVGFRMFSCDHATLEANLRAVKALGHNVVTVAGGAHPSAAPTETLRALPLLDYAFVGEGEEGLCLLARRLSGEDGIALEDVPGLVWRNENGEIRCNAPTRPRDLDTLGFPAWDLMDPRGYADAPEGVFLKNTPVAPISTSRGCPHACTFCASHAVTGRPLRVHSVPHVLDEIERLVEDYGVREIHIEDDNFTANRRRVLAFCAGVRQRGLRFSLTFPNGVRLDTLDDEVLGALRDIGCYSMIVGIESGNQRVLDSIRKRLKLDVIREKVALIARSGIEARAFFILGFPTETRAEMLDTIEFACSLPLTAAQFSVFSPLPGAPATRELQRAGLLPAEPAWEDLYYHRIAFTPKGVTASELRNLVRRAYLRFYLRPRILRALLGQIQTPAHLLAVAQRLRDYLAG